MLEEILDYRNITKALKRVVSNGGTSGVDGMDVKELTNWLETHWIGWKQSILAGTYVPAAVRRVEIPKPNGGKRMLGIPTVKDRLLGQAIHQWLNGLYEEGFSKWSYGFREGRSAHQAVNRSVELLEEGKVWVVEMDLDQFFDRVNHDKLMGKLARRIEDKRTLKLIRSYLNSGIMEGGLISVRSEGTPQGSPLSPLLSNIVLDELDKELEGRGHSFVRYADDISIYVKSEKAAERVKENITEYLEKELKLKVNRDKTRVSRSQESQLLGFTFGKSGGKWIARIAPKSLKRLKQKVKEQTRRNDPSSGEEKIKKLEAMIEGWVNYFRIARCKKMMQGLDYWLRSRLRICFWKQWKLPRTRQTHLRKLGARAGNAYMWGQSSWGYCRMAHSRALLSTLTNRHLQSLGYIGFSNHYYWKTTHQGKLF